jgi:lipopolysaccharide export system permease protein
MFVLLMQALWRMIDELVGKGLDYSIIAEFLFYVSITLVPMALPLAVLLASIMTFGSLGENYELIALKSAGISLYRIMKPLIIFIIGLTIFAFFFSNNILPVANLKMNSLYYDIRRQKPEMSFKEGIFTNDLEGYSIKVDRINKNTGMMYNVLIYSHKDGKGNYEVTKADSGLMQVTIICESGALADALSTACFVLGLEEGMALADKYGALALMVDTGRQVWYNSDEVPDLLEFSGEEKGYVLKKYE